MSTRRTLTDAQLATWLYKLMDQPEWGELWVAWQVDQVEAAITGCWMNEKVADMARDTRAMRQFVAWCGQFVKRKEGIIDGRTKRYKSARAHAAAQGEAAAAIGE